MFVKKWGVGIYPVSIVWHDLWEDRLGLWIEIDPDISIDTKNGVLEMYIGFTWGIFISMAIKAIFGG